MPDVTTLVVPDMTCRHAARGVSAAVRDVDGVRTVRADHRRRRLQLTGTVDPVEVVHAVRAAGYRDVTVVAD